MKARDYLDDFRSAISNAIKKYKSLYPNKNINLVDIIEKEIINLKFSDIILWDTLNKNCEELYRDKYIPRFIMKDDLDILLQHVLKKLFPREIIEKYQFEYLEELRIIAEERNKNLTSKNIKLKEKRNTFQVAAENAKKEIIKLEDEKKILQQEKDLLEQTVNFMIPNIDIRQETKRLLSENVTLLEKLNVKKDLINRLYKLNKALEDQNADLHEQIKEKNTEIATLKSEIMSENVKRNKNNLKPLLSSSSP